jgi:hypothetical protein
MRSSSKKEEPKTTEVEKRNSHPEKQHLFTKGVVVVTCLV